MFEAIRKFSNTQNSKSLVLVFNFVSSYGVQGSLKITPNHFMHFRTANGSIQNDLSENVEVGHELLST
jgi:hypothetical protein